MSSVLYINEIVSLGVVFLTQKIPPASAPSSAWSEIDERKVAASLTLNDLLVGDGNTNATGRISLEIRPGHLMDLRVLCLDRPLPDLFEHILDHVQSLQQYDHGNEQAYAQRRVPAQQVRRLCVDAAAGLQR